MAQPAVELRRSLAVASFAHSEYFDSVLKFGVSFGTSFQLIDERQQLSQFVFDQFVIEHRLSPAFILKKCLLSFSISFSGHIHIASPLVFRRGRLTGSILPDRGGPLAGYWQLCEIDAELNRHLRLFVVEKMRSCSVPVISSECQVWPLVDEFSGRR
jgi:hypothetical protein